MAPQYSNSSDALSCSGAPRPEHIHFPQDWVSGANAHRDKDPAQDEDSTTVVQKSTHRYIINGYMMYCSLLRFKILSYGRKRMADHELVSLAIFNQVSTRARLFKGDSCIAILIHSRAEYE